MNLTPAEAFLLLDQALLKATGTSTEALFMGLERRLFQVLARTWQARAKRALRIATTTAPVSDADIKRVLAGMAKQFDGWDDDCEPMVSAATRQSYVEGKQQILLRAAGKLGPLSPTQTEWPQLISKGPKATLIPSFTLADKSAIKRLVLGQLHWIGLAYDTILSQTIDKTVRETMLESGLGRKEAGELLRQTLGAQLGLGAADVPASWKGRIGSYFEGIAANTVGNGRVQGSMAEMVEIGVDRYTIVAAGDERMCSRCGFMDGQTFTVKHAQKTINEIMAARTPEDVKAAHPWPKNMKEMETNPNKFPFPPYHLLCRCTVDIAEDAEIQFDLD